MRVVILYLLASLCSFMSLSDQVSSAAAPQGASSAPKKWTHTRGKHDALNCTPMPRNCAYIKQKPPEQAGVEIWHNPDTGLWHQYAEVVNLPVGY